MNNNNNEKNNNSAIKINDHKLGGATKLKGKI